MVKSDSNPIFHVIMSRACLAQFGNIELVPFPNISISYPMKINYLYTCNVTFSSPTQFWFWIFYVGIRWLLPLSEHSSASCYKNCVYWVLRILERDERGTKKWSMKRDRMRIGIIGLENYFQTCQNQINNIHLHFAYAYDRLRSGHAQWIHLFLFCIAVWT